MILSALQLASLAVCASTAAATASCGCGNSLPTDVVPGADSTNVTIYSGGIERSYLIHLPANYTTNEPVPLILSFHGRTKSAAEQEELSQFSNASYNPRAIAVYPQGVANSKGVRQWTGDPDAPANVSDIAFTSDLITNLTSSYCVDTSRVYATGKSNGGGLVGLLACDPTTSAQIAAFAPVSGAFYYGVLGAANDSLPACNPSRSPIPILEFHGELDTTIPYDGRGPGGRGETAPVLDWVHDWVERDGFHVDSNVTTSVCQGTGYPEVERHSWGGGVVQHYWESNLKHTWPATYANDDDESGNYTTCYDGAAVIMTFFENFSL
ncbi:Alpha/Beta hydrolase protein [Phyllosticta citriasiana]|uniref:Alpha/Beta hydrolase protein n=1 Tax=Phyllosticta citriasiana TaxID=595635 RepID=UPI0030FDC84E